MKALETFCIHLTVMEGSIVCRCVSIFSHCSLNPVTDQISKLSQRGTACPASYIDIHLGGDGLMYLVPSLKLSSTVNKSRFLVILTEAVQPELYISPIIIMLTSWR